MMGFGHYFLGKSTQILFSNAGAQVSTLESYKKCIG